MTKGSNPIVTHVKVEGICAINAFRICVASKRVKSSMICVSPAAEPSSLQQAKLAYKSSKNAGSNSSLLFLFTVSPRRTCPETICSPQQTSIVTPFRSHSVVMTAPNQDDSHGRYNQDSAVRSYEWVITSFRSKHS